MELTPPPSPSFSPASPAPSYSPVSPVSVESTYSESLEFASGSGICCSLPSESKRPAWLRYMNSYTDPRPTAGVPHKRCTKVFLYRNLSVKFLEDDEEEEEENVDVEEALRIQICPRTYRLFFEPGTEDFFVRHVSLNRKCK